jgi:hypothetical protein
MDLRRPPENIVGSLAQFFSRNLSPASQQVSRPGAEQADKFYVRIYNISLSA